MQTDQFTKGMFLIVDDRLMLVMDRQYKTTGRQGGLIILELKDVLKGSGVSKTVKAGTKYEVVEPDYQEMQFLYSDGEGAYFMDLNSYENISLSKEVVGSYIDYLKEGDQYMVMLHDEKPVSIKEKQSVELEVTEAVEAVKGNTSQTATKKVTTETGLVVEVPLFVKKGDVITVNTESGEYKGRA